MNMNSNSILSSQHLST
ncbi:uncharacterized protein FFMR_00165 [Fusarium fujikuroi]|nr:uncharacterized protein FFM5_10359 [Fusarium fujikuroi]SCO27286.1 uncharacterized protein FFMR_00165 [Fusarium fujikuroi]